MWGEQYTVSDNKHAKELIQLGFKPTLCTSPQQCEALLKHCKENNMKFLKNSYGTLVHKRFGTYFSKSKSIKQWKLLHAVDQWDNETRMFAFDHPNLFQCKLDKELYILTASPYGYMDSQIIKELMQYPYNVYVVNPYFLGYIGFVENAVREHPLHQVSYAFTTATDDQMREINSIIEEGTGLYHVFIKVSGGAIYE